MYYGFSSAVSVLEAEAEANLPMVWIPISWVDSIFLTNARARSNSIDWYPHSDSP